MNDCARKFTLPIILAAAAAPALAPAMAAAAQPAQAPAKTEQPPAKAERPAATADKNRDEKKPTAQAVIDRYIEATGGRSAYEAVKSRRTQMKMKMPAAGMEMSMTITQARPDRMLMEIDIPGMGKSRAGFDGTTAWANDAMNGPRILEGAERTQLLRQGSLDNDLNMADNYKKMEISGSDTVDGKAVWVMHLTPEEGETEKRYFEKESGLLVRIDQTANTPMGEIPSQAVVGDYRKVGDVLIPHRTTIRMGPMEQVLEVEKVEHNVELADGTFEPPAEVKRLTEKRGS